MRIMHEASCHAANCFITLTYKDLTSDSLVYRDFQLFMKRLRKHFTGMTVRFYMCGEYGDENRRPHFHACLFGVDFLDKVVYKSKDGKGYLYTSPTLEKLWPQGFSTIGTLDFESAAYVARYVMKKVNGQAAFHHYNVIDYQTGEILKSIAPEFTHMSLGGRDAKGGIGKAWLQKWYSDVYPHGYVVSRGKEARTPRYYDKYFKKIAPLDYDEYMVRRELELVGREGENSPERLSARRAVLVSRIATYKRSL